MNVPTQWKTCGLQAQHASSRLCMRTANITLVSPRRTLPVEDGAAPRSKKPRRRRGGRIAPVSYHVAGAGYITLNSFIVSVAYNPTIP